MKTRAHCYEIPGWAIARAMVDRAAREAGVTRTYWISMYESGRRLARLMQTRAPWERDAQR